MGKKKQSGRKCTFITIALLLLIFAALVFILLTQEQKPDPASEKIIRQAVAEQFGKYPNDLTDEDFAKITEFKISIKTEFKFRRN